MLSWHATRLQWMLEINSGLAPAGWQRTTDLITSDGFGIRLIFAPPGQSSFYRLHEKP